MFRNILVPLDGSKLSEASLSAASLLAAEARIIRSRCCTSSSRTPRAKFTRNDI